MFHLAYNFLSILLIIPLAIFNIYRSIRLSTPLAMRERFGFVPKEKLAKIAGHPVIWLHAVSVGEIIAARPLLKLLRKRYPNHAIVVTNTTETGKRASASFSEIDLSLYFPFDLLFSVRAMLSAIKPRIIIIMETEIWPNFCHEAARRYIPLILANGRISDRSFKRYLKFSWFFRSSLRSFTAICMQSEIGERRIAAIGARAESISVAGNLKNDIPYRLVDETERNNMRNLYSIPNSCKVFVAGSTRNGEEPYIISTYKALSEKFDDLLMVLVPRHPERTHEIADLIESAGLTYRKRSNLVAGEFLKVGEILLVDTVGEMMNFYALSDIAFVGGSLVPVGGHNLLEPISVGIPVVFGTYMANFREIEADVLQYGAGIQVKSPAELTTVCETLICSLELRKVLGNNGLKLMRDKGGAAERHLEIMEKCL